MQYTQKTIDGLTINIPVGSMDKPCEFGEAVVKLIQHPGNWKLSTGEFETSDIDKAERVAYALDWYMGGHEMREETEKGGVTNYVVSSKGYYHYIGA